jgi:TolB protein
MKKVSAIGGLLAAAIAAVIGMVALETAPSSATFPGTNGKIAFSSIRDGNYEIYVMNAGGSGQTNLTNNPAIDQTSGWSPDGTKLAFTSNRDGGQDIYAMNADGSGVVRLTFLAGNQLTPAWSPDGTKIAFTSDGDGNNEIYVMNANGTGITRLTFDPALDWNPSWSPDGAKIVFRSDRAGNYEIYVMNANGSNQTNLTNNPNHDNNPDWSPDGSKIAFTRRISGNDEIHVMNADGSSQTQLTNKAGVDDVAAWSPDGTKIAYISEGVGGDWDVFVMNADGSAPTNLTNTPAREQLPEWQRLTSTATPTVTPSPTATATPSPSLPIQGQLANCFQETNIAYGHNNLEGEWLAFEPGAPDVLQTLDHFAIGEGYLVNVDADCTISADGHNIALYNGWNLFGWPPAAPSPSGDIKAQLADCLESINIANGLNNETKVWTVFEPSAPPVLQTLTGLAASGGYFINASNVCHIISGPNHVGLYEGWNLVGWR